MTESALQVVGRLHTTPNRVVMGRRDSYRPVSFLTETDVNHMADAARTMRDGERNELLILTLFQGALRASEAVQLTPNRRQIIDGKHILAVVGKGNKPRLVAIPERLSHHIGDYAGRAGITGDTRYFPITRFRALQIVKECAAKAGIERRVYTHLLRHGGAVARLAQTGNPKSLQMFLGHSDLKMTLRYLSTLQTIQSLEVESKVEFDR
jgi:integrase/recombinase XerD